MTSEATLPKEKKTWKRRTGIILLAAAIAVTLAAVPPARIAVAQPGGGEARPPRPLVDTVLDANGDGIIDEKEIANAATALKKLDTNGDGKLTPGELRPKRSDSPGARGGEPPQGKSGRPPDGASPQKKPRPPIEVILDANGDGVIDAGEIAGAPKILPKLDKNGDRRLSPDEYRPPRPADGGALPSPKPEQKQPR